VLDDDRVLALWPGDGSRTHGERLPGEIASALDAAGVARGQVDLFAVATGPGAFTGLRIGLAAIQGLAMTLRKPVVGVSALDALAHQAGTSAAEMIVPWMDAQRGDVFATVIERTSGAVLEPPTAANPITLLEIWRSHLDGRQVLFIGDGVVRDRDAIARLRTGQWDTRVPAALAPDIAVLARRRAEAGGAGLPHTLEPIYVRRPDAEIERDRRQPERPRQ